MEPKYRNLDDPDAQDLLQRVDECRRLLRIDQNLRVLLIVGYLILATLTTICIWK